MEGLNPVQAFALQQVAGARTVAEAIDILGNRAVWDHVNGLFVPALRLMQTRLDKIFTTVKTPGSIHHVRSPRFTTTGDILVNNSSDAGETTGLSWVDEDVTLEPFALTHHMQADIEMVTPSAAAAQFSVFVEHLYRARSDHALTCCNKVFVNTPNVRLLERMMHGANDISKVVKPYFQRIGIANESYLDLTSIGADINRNADADHKLSIIVGTHEMFGMYGQRTPTVLGTMYADDVLAMIEGNTDENWHYQGYGSVPLFDINSNKTNPPLVVRPQWLTDFAIQDEGEEMKFMNLVTGQWEQVPYAPAADNAIVYVRQYLIDMSDATFVRPQCLQLYMIDNPMPLLGGQDTVSRVVTMNMKDSCKGHCMDPTFMERVSNAYIAGNLQFGDVLEYTDLYTKASDVKKYPAATENCVRPLIAIQISKKDADILKKTGCLPMTGTIDAYNNGTNGHLKSLEFSDDFIAKLHNLNLFGNIVTGNKFRQIRDFAGFGCPTPRKMYAPIACPATYKFKKAGSDVWEFADPGMGVGRFFKNRAVIERGIVLAPAPPNTKLQ